MAEYNNYQTDYQQPRRLKGKIIWGIVILIALFLLSLVMRYGQLEVQLSSAASAANVDLELVNSKSGSVTSKKISGSYKRFLLKGNYEIKVRAGQTSGLAVTRTKGWFGKTVVRMDLKPEAQRTFVGNNPQGCQFYLGNTLYSYTCDDNADKLTTHVPAQSNQPTYVLQNSAGIVGTIIGSVQTDSRAYLLVKGVQTEASDSSVYKVYIISPGLKTASVRPLSSLDDSKDYDIAAYLEGFLVHDDSFQSNFYYSFDFSESRKITIAKPAVEDQRPYLMAASSYGLLAMYSDRADDTDITNPKGFGEINTDIVALAKGQNLRFNLSQKFDHQITSALLCGSLKLCILAGSQLTVYDITGGQPKAMYNIANVSYMTTSGSSLLLVRGDDVIDFKADSAIGFVSYSLGLYTYCGLQPLDDNRYSICLSDLEGKNVALLINKSVTDSDAIDKKILSLEEMAEISNVSITGKHIFITPNVSDSDYNSTTNSYSYNSSSKKAANDKIDEKINQLGLRSRYTIVNTLP